MAVTNITKNTKVSFAYVPKDVEFKNPSDNIIYFIADQQKIYLDGVYYGYADGDFSLNSIIDKGNGNAITGLTAEGKTITATRNLTFATQEEMNLLNSSLSGSLSSLTEQIQGLQGAFIYIGTIDKLTSEVTNDLLRARIQVLQGRAPKQGDVLVDKNNIEWYYNGTDWNEYGPGEIGIASSNNFGLIRTNYQDNNKNYGIKVDAQGDAYVNVPWKNDNTTYSEATTSTLGLVKLGTSKLGVLSTPAATTILNRYYPVGLDKDSKLVVNVPWTDNITYTAEDGIKLDGTIFKHTNNVTASNAGPSANASPGYGGTFTVPYIVYDKHGHITSKTNRTITLPAAQTIPNLSGGASAATGKYVSAVTVSGHTVTVTQESLPTLIESANKLNTARDIKIGNKSRSFNGTAPLTYTLDEIFDVNSPGVLERNSSGAYQTSNNYVKGGYGTGNNFYIDGIHQIMFTDDSNPWHSSSERNVIYAKIKEINQEEFREYLVLGGRDGIILENNAGSNHAEYKYEPNLNLINRKTLIHKGYVDDAISNAFDLYLNWTVIS